MKTKLRKWLLAPVCAAFALGTGLAAEPAWIDVEPQILPVTVAEDSMSLSAVCATFDTWWRIDFAANQYKRGALLVVR